MTEEMTAIFLDRIWLDRPVGAVRRIASGVEMEVVGDQAHIR